jgi:predicted DNA-binding transcriptional regulator AlpA
MTTPVQRVGIAVPTDADELLTLAAVRRLFGGVDASTVYRNVKRGLIPAPIRPTPNTSRWLRSECAAALAQRMEARHD